MRSEICHTRTYPLGVLCRPKPTLIRVASSGNDLVALGKTLLDKFGAETCRCPSDEEDFGCHFDLLCFEELKTFGLKGIRNGEASGMFLQVNSRLPFEMMMVLTSKWTQLLTPPKSGGHSKPFSSSVPSRKIPRWKSTKWKSSPLSTVTIWQKTAQLLRMSTLMASCSRRWLEFRNAVGTKPSSALH